MSDPRLILGSGGGGGKSGGGKSITPKEDPDTLRSKQYARVLDLLSEGEIEGLVNGLQSVYLDDTPVENSDGTKNFTGLTVVTRNGTQNQDYIPGFSSSESENAVVTQLKAGIPVVRSVSSPNIDALRLTVSVPQLSSYDTKNAVLGGTNVSFKVEVQNNGGGFKEAKLRVIPSTLQTVTATELKTPTPAVAANLTMIWTGTLPANSNSLTYLWYLPPQPLQVVEWVIEYRAVGAPSWTTLKTGIFSGTPKKVMVQQDIADIFGSSPIDNTLGNQYQIVAPTGSASVSLDSLTEGNYEFRTRIVSGPGSLRMSGGCYVYTGVEVIKGKTMSKYQRNYRIPLEGSGPWDVRLTRITADSTSTNIQNETWWDSYTEIIDAKLAYPNSALAGISVDSQQFQNIPTRGYHIRGIRVKVPTNYDPVLRQYSGIWDGTFKVAWTNNPVWCWYDMATNTRYGLGQYIRADQIDKWALYQVSQYCDEMVSDGLGGLEPRFTCNMYLQTQEDAYVVLVSMASIFRAMLYWASNTVMMSQDSPKEPVALFAPANVVGGVFNYSGSSVKARHTVAIVSWNDPKDRFKQKLEYVEDPDGVALYGVQSTEIAAIGCTSRGQAHRLGRWLLYSERLETETVSFKAGLDGLGLSPGDVIQTTDPVRSGTRMGGRIVSATDSAITLDAPVTLLSGQTYTLWVALPDDTVESRTVSNGTGATTVLNLSTPLSQVPQNMSMWTLSGTNLVPETWRVVTIKEDGVNAEVTALAYDGRKYEAVEADLVLEPKPSTITATQPDAPSDVRVTEALVMLSPAVVGARVTVSWSGDAQFYEVSYRVGDGNFNTITTKEHTVDIQPVEPGEWTIQIIARNLVGIRSPTTTVIQEIYGLRTPPVDVENLQLAPVGGLAFLTFNASVDLDVIVGGRLRVRHTSLTTGADWASAVDIGPSIPGSATSATLPLVAGTYLAKWVDSTDNESENAVAVVTTAPSVIVMNAVETVVEHPEFAGTRTGVWFDEVLQGIKLDSFITIDDILENIDTVSDMDSFGQLVTYGEYISPTTIDLGAVMTSRITASLVAETFDAVDLIDSRAAIDTWLDVDGALISDASAQLYLRTTNDDPAGTPTWSAWQPFFMGDWAARAFQFKVVLETETDTHNVVVKEMSITVDMPDRMETGNDVISGLGVYAVTYPQPFKTVKGRGITAENMASGDYYQITNETNAGFDIVFKDQAGNVISRTFDYTTVGYGNA